VALRFLDAGASVLALDQNDDGLGWVDSYGERARGVPADVRDIEQLRAAVAAAVDAFGSLDTVAAIAGVSRVSGFLDMSHDDRDLVFDVNLVGVWNTFEAAIPTILEAGGPKRAIACGSVQSVLGSADGAAYCAAKHALVGFVKSLALEFATTGLTVNLVSPASVATPMILAAPSHLVDYVIETTPVKRLSTPEEVAAFFEFVAGPETDYLTGENIVIDGGLKAINAHTFRPWPQ
jgi:NAD(P)-dependent dehydrogenase (short-subunit alcohol dehydrogenase family)